MTKQTFVNVNKPSPESAPGGWSAKVRRFVALSWCIFVSFIFCILPQPFWASSLVFSLSFSLFLSLSLSLFLSPHLCFLSFSLSPHSCFLGPISFFLSLSLSLSSLVFSLSLLTCVFSLFFSLFLSVSCLHAAPYFPPIYVPFWPLSSGWHDGRPPKRTCRSPLPVSVTSQQQMGWTNGHSKRRIQTSNYTAPWQCIQLHPNSHHWLSLVCAVSVAQLAPFLVLRFFQCIQAWIQDLVRRVETQKSVLQLWSWADSPFTPAKIDLLIPAWNIFCWKVPDLGPILRWRGPALLSFWNSQTQRKKHSTHIEIVQQGKMTILNVQFFLC